MLWKYITQSQLLTCFEVTSLSHYFVLFFHISNPQSSLTLPSLTFWNCLSYHSGNATLHTYLHVSYFQIPIKRHFYHHTLPISFPDVLQWFLDPHQSVNLSSPFSTVAVWRSKARWGWRKEGRMDGVRTQRATEVLMAVHTCRGQQPSCLQETSLTCCSNLWVHKHFWLIVWKGWFLVSVFFFRWSHPGISVHPSSTRLKQTIQWNFKQNDPHPCVLTYTYCPNCSNKGQLYWCVKLK